MEEEKTLEWELTKFDVLALSLLQRMLYWLGIEATPVDEFINGCLPYEKDKGKLRGQLRPPDLEMMCIYDAVVEYFAKHKDKIDGCDWTGIVALLNAFKMSIYVHPSKQIDLEDGESIEWSVVRHRNQVWWVSRRPKIPQMISLGDLFRGP